MNAVSITPEVFAKLVGRDDSHGTLLFEVTPEFIDLADADVGEWSDLLQLRFVRRAGSFVELELRKIG
jgi:hypothetical protein